MKMNRPPSLRPERADDPLEKVREMTRVAAVVFRRDDDDDDAIRRRVMEAIEEALAGSEPWHRPMPDEILRPGEAAGVAVSSRGRGPTARPIGPPAFHARIPGAWNGPITALMIQCVNL